jgi:hypothetical protein
MNVFKLDEREESMLDKQNKKEATNKHAARRNGRKVRKERC